MLSCRLVSVGDEDVELVNIVMGERDGRAIEISGKRTVCFFCLWHVSGTLLNVLGPFRNLPWFRAVCLSLQDINFPTATPY